MSMLQIVVMMVAIPLEAVRAADRPREGTIDAEQIAQAAATHWAFQPIRNPTPPPVHDASWAATTIDRFVLARLEAKGLSPSPSAERRTLIRRVTFDLIGLPPTPDEIDAFVADDSPDAYAALVDRLLASPQYGERWGRHWLDVARYADTRGYALGREPRFPFAYAYRDYVIRALNEDVPYDQFIVEQIAADRMDLPEPSYRLAAMGFLTVGRQFLRRHDTLDDQIDVVTRGLLGLSVACARCHDHKYDPIPTADYYSLYGVFASTTTPDELPLVAPPPETPAYREYETELRKRRTAVETLRREKHTALVDEIRTGVSEYLLHVLENKDEPDGAALSLSPGDVRPKVVERWRHFLAEQADVDHPIFGLWHAFTALPEDDFAEQAAKIVAGLRSVPDGSASARMNERVRRAFIDRPPTTRADVARVYGTLLTDVHTRFRSLLESHAKAVAGGDSAGDPPAGLPEPADEQLRAVLYASGTPTALTIDEADRLYDRATRNKLNELRTAVETWRVHSAGAPPRAMIVVDSEKPVDPYVFLRGNPGRKGPPVPRRFVQVLASVSDQPFEDGSGRIELARAIANPRNPLTARVLVNRIWMHDFGSGLVRTPSDFGTRGEPPTHPELLDHLATTFIDDDWSIKNLHRRILLSNTYRQRSADNAASRRIDPQNRLLWRMNRRRLEFEPLRDALLAVAGRLDDALGGRPVDLHREPFSNRRSVYGFIDRQDLPGLFRVFDLASPDASCPRRAETTVPQQALFLMNSPFVLEQARHLIDRPDVRARTETADRVDYLYRLILGRGAGDDEQRRAQDFLEGQDFEPTPDDDAKAMLTRWQQYVQVLLLTNEFVFVD